MVVRATMITGVVMLGDGTKTLIIIMIMIKMIITNSIIYYTDYIYIYTHVHMHTYIYIVMCNV